MGSVIDRMTGPFTIPQHTTYHIMQLCNILLRISPETSVKTTIPRLNVSPAEIAILLAIKGENSVRFNGGLREVSRSNGVEIGRLQLVYKEAFAKIFAGHSPVMPTTFAQVGFDVSRVPEAEPYVPAPEEAASLIEESYPIDANGNVVETADAAPKASVQRAVKKRPAARNKKPRESLLA